MKWCWAMGALLVWGCGGAPLQSEKTAPPVAPAAALAPAETLEFGDFLAPGPVLGPSARVQALNGKRVRLVGYMAQMEIPPIGGFYLAPHPVRCDEGGGGTGDLPLESVLVLSTTAKDRPVPFLPGKLEVSGVLEVGRRAEADGRVSAFRLRLDSGAPDHQAI